jgi:hypothetical protein
MNVFRLDFEGSEILRFAVELSQTNPALNGALTPPSQKAPEIPNAHIQEKKSHSPLPTLTHTSNQLLVVNLRLENINLRRTPPDIRPIRALRARVHHLPPVRPVRLARAGACGETLAGEIRHFAVGGLLTADVGCCWEVCGWVRLVGECADVAGAVGVGVAGREFRRGAMGDETHS